MVDRIMTPPTSPHTHKDVHVLILKTYEYVTLRGKVDFADVIKVKDLEMGSTSYIISESLKGENLFQLWSEGDLTTGSLERCNEKRTRCCLF